MNKNLCRRASFKKVQSSTSWGQIVIIAFILILSACIFVASGRISNIIAPAGAFAVACFLYIRHPCLYIEFVLWVCFLAPLARRLIDYQGGFTDPSPVLLAPYLAMLPTAYTSLRYLPKFNHPGGPAFILVFSSIGYGFLLGLINASVRDVLICVIEWFPPITLGWYLGAKWKDYPLYAKRFQRIFLWCVLLTGSYGIYQYLTAPQWDSVWLNNMIDQLSIITFGNPEPLEIRVWSTMHGPFVFAVCMSAGILLLLSKKGILSIIAIIIGTLSLLLSQVRTSWVGLIIGLAMLMISMKQSVQIRLILILIAIVAGVIALSSIDSFAEVINTRVSSLTDGTQDNSAVGRIGTYKSILNQSLTNFLGNGFSRSVGGDSGLLEILIRLGWLGGLPYFFGLLFLVIHPMSCPGVRSDIFARTINAVVITLFAQIPLGNSMIETQGAILWAFIGMKLSAWKYYSSNPNIDKNFQLSIPQPSSDLKSKTILREYNS